MAEPAHAPALLQPIALLAAAVVALLLAAWAALGQPPALRGFGLLAGVVGVAAAVLFLGGNYLGLGMGGRTFFKDGACHGRA